MIDTREFWGCPPQREEEECNSGQGRWGRSQWGCFVPNRSFPRAVGSVVGSVVVAVIYLRSRKVEDEGLPGLPGCPPA